MWREKLRYNEGFLTSRTPDQIVADAEPVVDTNAQQFLTGLAGHIEKCFQEASKWHATHLTPRILDCNRRKKGEYPPEVFAALTKLGGCKLYFNKSAEKCSALEAGLEEVLLNASGRENRPWRLAPTPIPDLPASVKESIRRQIVEEYSAKVSEIEAMAETEGLVPDDVIRGLAQEVMQASLDLFDEEQKRLFEEARIRVERMEDYIADQLVEGGFYDALHGVIQQISTYPIGIIKGPCFEFKKKLTWSDDGTLTASEYLAPTFRYVPLSNIFWMPDAQSLNDGYVIERRPYSVTTLNGMMNSKGWIASELKLAISEWKDSGRTNTDMALTGDAELAVQQGRSPHSQFSTTSLFAKEFWGLISGEDILEWANGLSVVLTEHGFDEGEVVKDGWYYICATKIGDHIVNVRKNPDLLDNTPFRSTCYEKVLESVCGKSPVEKMASSQDAYNIQLRAAINNGIMASGPTIVYDLDSCDAATIGSKIQPYAQIGFRGNASNGARAPFFFYQTENVQRPALEMARFFSDMAGDDSGIQPITYANGNSGPASATAYGVGVLQNAAERILKRVFGYIDRDIIAPCLNALVQWNNLFPESNPNLVGDAIAVPCGALLAMQRDSIMMRRIEYAASSNNPVDIAIMGERGRANLMREIATGLYLPPDKIIPPDSYFAERARKAMEYQATQAIPDSPTETPPETPPDTGDAPAQGEDLIDPSQIDNPHMRVKLQGQDIEHGATYHA